MTTDPDQVASSLSQLSLHSNGASETEDWDRTLNIQPGSGQRISLNSIAFPAGAGREEDGAKTPRPEAGQKGKTEAKRTLSELLRLHAEKGTNVTFSPEEASRIAEVLGQWINSESSPYESEDDFFTRSHAQDDSALGMRSPSATPVDTTGRSRGHSESVVNVSGASIQS
ncbi:hypothetical protein OBBRIDRAFT_790353 [Obba rivulosa]|uniref:Uncharacterized protein n=1 Tax=Obba rivulosa TaxID=1052685 RepID=A0A8E2J2I9_9APHY|nr:hypothetical protein OBBRIDRAFT_790353 [Obba rivulosa]